MNMGNIRSIILRMSAKPFYLNGFVFKYHPHRYPVFIQNIKYNPVLSSTKWS